ncbi:MAG: hypothetical protein ACFFDX_05740 [Candidatus Odinarchaeota archaeon]
MHYLERNYHILEARMIEQMEKSFELGRKLIDTELDAGLLNFIVKPVVKTFYDYWTQNDARSGTLKQIKVTLEVGKELVFNQSSEEYFDKLITENFPEYLKADQTTHQCKKSHKNYERLVEIAKKTFINYVKEAIIFLEVKENVYDYGDLCRLAFNDKENARKNLMMQLNYTDEAISIIEEDPTILSIPVGKKIIVKSLRRGFEETKKEFIEALDDTYDREH